MILHTKSPGSPKSFQEASRKVQKISGRNPEIISLVFWEKLIIIKLTDLYQGRDARLDRFDVKNLLNLSEKDFHLTNYSCTYSRFLVRFCFISL